MTLPNGTIVGDYEIIGVIGQGGMGAVYKVRNTISDRVEAMKVLLPNLVAEPGLADRFLREIKLLAKLDHPNITGLRTAFRANDQLWMVMELVDGRGLDQVIQSRRLTVEEATEYTRQALGALAYAHDMGVIHRDLKPANIILTSKGTVKLTDFGIARESGDVRLTRTGTALGSIAYMSPEQIQHSAVDARSDVYSMGVTFYELVTGKLPFNAQSDYAIMSAHVMTPPRPPVELNPAIPPHLSQVLLRSLEKDPAKRFQTAWEFRDALNPDLTVTRISGATQIPPPVVIEKKSRAGLLMAGGLIAAGAGAALIFMPRTQPLSPPVVAVQPTPTPLPTPPPTPTPILAKPAIAPTTAPAAVDPVQAEWEKLKSTTSIDELNAFREKHPGTPYARLAFLRIVEVQWESARESHSAARLKKFIETHPNSAYTEQAKAELEKAEKSSVNGGITQTLEKFTAACNARDLTKVQELWPTLNGRRLQTIAAMLKNPKSVDFRIDLDGDIQTSGDMAIVPVRYQQHMIRQNGEPWDADEKLTITMRKVGDNWVIQILPPFRDAQGLLKKKKSQ